MIYLNEHLLPGLIGNLAIYISVGLAGLSFIFYNLYGFKDKIALKKIADYSFIGHFILISIAVVILFLILFNHYFEYSYVWQYSSRSLSITYLISSFWAGQEGSFLLWLFFQAAFGIIIYIGKSSNKDKTMGVIALAQVFLLILLISIKPFELLRNNAVNSSLDFFKDPSYMAGIIDGNSLNPLLQNFWMAIHPPVLFLGYAVTIIPFGMALAYLVSRESKLLKYIRKWTIGSVFLLGLGLFLGGVWAYEDLSFGGFWSWDPVENASLVPWLFLLASLHLLIVFRKQGTAQRSAIFATLLPYIFVIYSSFLTRSGFLKDTSAHSFGGDGKAYMFFAFLMVFIIIALVIFLKNFRKLESKSQEQPSSKEFWLFIGSVVMMMSAFQIIFVTSIPVLNQILGTQFLILNEREAFYNLWQGGFAIIILLIMTATYFLNNGKTEFKSFILKFAVPFIPAVIITVTISFFIAEVRILDTMLLFPILFLILSSLDNILRHKRKGASLGATISHIGFSIFLLGVLIAFGQKELLTKGENNPFGMNVGNENLLLVKGDIKPFGEKFVSYSEKKWNGDEVIYKLDVLTKKDTSYFIDYTLYPSVKMVTGYGSSYRPYIKTWLLEDVFVFLSRADVEKNEYKDAGLFSVGQNDTVSFPASKLVIDSLKFFHEKGDSLVTAKLRYIHIRDKAFSLTASRKVKPGLVSTDDAILEAQGIKFSIVSSDGKKKIGVKVFQKKMDYIVVKSQAFPFINLLWLGGIVLFAGVLLSFLRFRKKLLIEHSQSN